MPEKKVISRRRTADAEDKSSAGRDEAWFANIKREYDQQSVIDNQSSRNNQTIANKAATAHLKHAERLDIIAERQLNNSVTADRESSERTNLHNTTTIENLNQQNDAAFLLLARSLADGEEVTVTIRKRKVKA
jgi:hypothetical protein